MNEMNILYNFFCLIYGGAGAGPGPSHFTPAPALTGSATLVEAVLLLFIIISCAVTAVLGEGTERKRYIIYKKNLWTGSNSGDAGENN